MRTVPPCSTKPLCVILMQYPVLFDNRLLCISVSGITLLLTNMFVS